MNFELGADILSLDYMTNSILTLTSCHHGYPVNYYYYDYIQQIIVISILNMVLVTMDTHLSGAMIYKDLKHVALC